MGQTVGSSPTEELHQFGHDLLGEPTGADDMGRCPSGVTIAQILQGAAESPVDLVNKGMDERSGVEIAAPPNEAGPRSEPADDIRRIEGDICHEVGVGVELLDRR